MIKIEDFDFGDLTLKDFDLIMHYSGFFSLFQIEGKRKVFKYIENRKVIGALVFSEKPEQLILEALEVLEKNRGIGTALLNELKEYAKKVCIDEIITEALVNTIPFYQKNGFFTLEPTSAVTKMCFLFNNPINTSQLSLDLGV